MTKRTNQSLIRKHNPKTDKFGNVYMYIQSMSEIINYPYGLKPVVPERVNNSCTTCDTRHDSDPITGNIHVLHSVNKPFNICGTEM